MRRRSRDGVLALNGFEDWCRWALAEADTLDPEKNFARLSIEHDQQERRRIYVGLNVGSLAVVRNTIEKTIC
jgi:hypothetical protein